MPDHIKLPILDYDTTPTTRWWRRAWYIRDFSLACMFIAMAGLCVGLVPYHTPAEIGLGIAAWVSILGVVLGLSSTASECPRSEGLALTAINLTMIFTTIAIAMDRFGK